MIEFKQRLHEILNVADPGDRTSRFFDIFILALIWINVLAVVLETVQPLLERYELIFQRLELFTVAVFTVEYLGRLWSITKDRQYRHPVTGRLRFATTPLALIDLLAILPFYLQLIGADFRLLRALRLFRMFRLFKSARYFQSMRRLGSLLKEKQEELTITMFAVSLLLLFSSSLMYVVERNGPNGNNFSSIPATMWWAVATLTTVGYGDVYPVTPLGQLLAGVIALLGVGVIALPAGIIASGLAEIIEADEEIPTHCPHCGESLHEATTPATNGAKHQPQTN